MDKKELLDNLRTLTEAVEKSCNDDETDVGKIVEGILDNTDISCVYETVRKIVSAVVSYSDSTKMSFAKCINEDGWIKAGDVMSCKTVASTIANMTLDSQKEEAIGSLIDALEESAGTNSALARALEKQGYVQKGSGEFDDLAKEWAEDNDWIYLDDWSFEDLADRFDNSTVRDFVVEYIQDNL